MGKKTSLRKKAAAYAKMLSENNGEYCKEFDAYFNSETGDWLEQKCSDSQCEFCSIRPDKAPPNAELIGALKR